MSRGQLNRKYIFRYYEEQEENLRNRVHSLHHAQNAVLWTKHARVISQVLRSG